jgi:hypothetical protein
MATVSGQRGKSSHIYTSPTFHSTFSYICDILEDLSNLLRIRDILFLLAPFFKEVFLRPMYRRVAELLHSTSYDHMISPHILNTYRLSWMDDMGE